MASAAAGTINTIKQGDTVLIAAREATAGDVKSGLYFAHYANLRGTVLRLYGEEAAVQVDRDSLPPEVRARHEEGEQAMRSRWLDNLSETARTGLSEREKSFALNYAVLVSVADLRPAPAGSVSAPPPAAPISPAAKAQAKAVGKAARAVDPVSGESQVDRADPKADGASESGSDSAVKRATAAELDAKEQAFLEERAANAKNNGSSRKSSPDR
jgi:hypothetical protein